MINCGRLNGNGPAGAPTPRDPAHRTVRITVDSTDSSARAHPSTKEKLAKLEEKLAHELMDDEEFQELRDRVLRKLGL
jgi:hypothetical protein